MTKPTRHVVFNPSARASLLHALKTLGRPDEVVAMFDDLQCGPIEPFDPQARERWFDETLRVDFEPGRLPRTDQEFWSLAVDERHRLVAWTTRHHAQDHLGFLLWASRLGERSGEVVDISNFEFEHRGMIGQTNGPLPVALVTPDKLVSLGLFDHARPVTEDERTSAALELARLGREAGDFRQTRDGKVISLPLTAFDDELIGAASLGFRKAAFVIGTAIMALLERETFYVSDLVLAARLMVLVEEGRLEAQGDPYGSIRYFEVRLPQK